MKKSREVLLVLFATIPLVLLAGCGDDSTTTDDAGTDTDASADTDTDTDNDTDTDTDSDADTDIDTDTDNDTDTETDSDAGVDSGGDTDIDAEVTDCAGGRLDVAHNLCWQHPIADWGGTWQEAINYCDALELAGHTDWVLPTRQDFIDMLGNCDADVLSGGAGFCDSCAESDTCGELFGSDGHGWYRSSSPGPGSNAWYADFSDGWVGSSNVAYDFYYIRCVRPGP